MGEQGNKGEGEQGEQGEIENGGIRRTKGKRGTRRTGETRGTGEQGKKGTTRVVLVCQHLFNCQRENKQNNLRKCLPEHD